MTKEDLHTVAQVLGAAYRDAPWKSLGLRRRPRGGSFWRKLFRAEWKNRLDHSVFQQIIALFTAVSVLAGKLQRSTIEEVVVVYVDGYGPVRDLYKTLGYKTRYEAVAHLHRSIINYVDSKPQEWSKLLTKELGVFELPDKRLAARLMLGVVELSMDMEYLRERMSKGTLPGTG